MADNNSGYTGEYGFTDGSIWQNGIMIRPPTNTGTALATPGQSQTTTTSDPVRLALDKLNTDITNTATKPMSITYNGQTYSDPSAMLEARRSALETRRTNEIARINADFDVQETNQKQAQKSEVGSSSMGLARIGGFDSASGQAVLTNLGRVHEQEVQALFGKRQAAISLAQQAYEDKDFELARMQIEEAKDAEQKIYDRQKDFFNMTLDWQRNQREDLKFEWDKGQLGREMQKEMFQFGLKYNTSKLPFFEFGGTVFAQDGTAMTDPEMALKYGVKPDFSNVFAIPEGAAKEYGAGIIGEYQYYVDQEKAAGRKPLTFVQYQNEDANRKIRINAASAPKVSDVKGEYELLKSQAPATIRRLAAEGKTWGEVADALSQLNLDPNEFDDAFHRAYSSPEEYEKWRLREAKVKKGEDPE